MKEFFTGLAMIFFALANVGAKTFSCVDRLTDISFDHLQKVRLDMVDRVVAPQKIQIMAYILNHDVIGIELLQHLIKASQRGIAVQLLVDGIGPGANLPISNELIAAIHTLAPQFEIKIFNPKYKLFQIHHRMHDKLFLVGDLAVIGSSSTWEPSVRGTLIEKDILVRGRNQDEDSVLNAMHKHFDEFWKASQSKVQKPLQTMAMKSVYDGFGANKLDPEKIDHYLGQLRNDALSTTIADVGESLLDLAQHSVFCPRLTYIRDTPRKSPGGSCEKILAFMAAAKEEIVIVSPYMILVPEVRSLLTSKIKNDHVRVVLITTSISTMAQEFPPIGKAYGDDLPGLARDGFNVREYSGPDGDQMLHAKMIRVDGQTFFVGSFNFDPLSATNNTENGLWIETDGAVTNLFIQKLNGEIEDYLASAQLIVDGEGRLVVKDPHRCDRVNCSNILRMITPFVRNML